MECVKEFNQYVRRSQNDPALVARKKAQTPKTKAVRCPVCDGTGWMILWQGCSHLDCDNCDGSGLAIVPIQTPTEGGA